MSAGVTVLAAALSAALAVFTWPSRADRSRRRLDTLLPGEIGPGRPSRSPGAVRGRVLAAVGAGCGVAFVVGLPWGVPVGAVVAVLGYVVLGRLEPASVRRRNARVAADLPVAVDLMAACLRSGSTPTAAAEAVCRGVGGPVGESLQEVVSLLRLGGDPVESWAVLHGDAALAPLGRAVGRAMSSGAPVVAALEQVAADAREQRRGAADEAARKVGVKAAAPLGLCFLPAFVLVGVVPVVAGIAANVDLW